MEKNRDDLVKWALGKAEEYLLSAQRNVEEERLYVAAEEAFRAIENSLEALLYSRGITRIAYPGGEKEFTGRLALQFLVRDQLLGTGMISRADYNRYLEYASALHHAGYQYGTFDEKKVRQALGYAEDIFYRAKAIMKK